MLGIALANWAAAIFVEDDMNKGSLAILSPNQEVSR